MRTPSLTAPGVAMGPSVYLRSAGAAVSTDPERSRLPELEGDDVGAGPASSDRVAGQLGAVVRPYPIRTPNSATEVVWTKEVAFESHRERIRYGRHLDAIQFRHSSGDRR